MLVTSPRCGCRQRDAVSFWKEQNLVEYLKAHNFALPNQETIFPLKGRQQDRFGRGCCNRGVGTSRTHSPLADICGPVPQEHFHGRRHRIWIYCFDDLSLGGVERADWPLIKQRWNNFRVLSPNWKITPGTAAILSRKMVVMCGARNGISAANPSILILSPPV